MPWVKKDMCVGCQICINECTVGAISLVDDVAVIDQEECIRCGVCHDVCPKDAVRHDSELIPVEIKMNIDWVHKLMNHPYYAGKPERQKGLLGRLQRHFKKIMEVTGKTLEQLDTEFKMNSDK
jgi:ferredoxin